MKSHSRTHSEREAAQDRDEARRQEYARYALHTAIASIYDARRLTEADVDHMAELYSEGRVYNRNASLRSTHE